MIYFQRREFACSCGCRFDAMDDKLLDILTDIREHFGKPVHINSANRCPSHNHRIGGTERSYHVRGRAADIWIDGVNPDEIANYLDDKYPYSLGVGRYNWGVHIDNRDKKTRWDLR